MNKGCVKCGIGNLKTGIVCTGWQEGHHSTLYSYCDCKAGQTLKQDALTRGITHEYWRYTK